MNRFRSDPEPDKGETFDGGHTLNLPTGSPLKISDQKWAKLSVLAAKAGVGVQEYFDQVILEALQNRSDDDDGGLMALLS